MFQRRPYSAAAVLLACLLFFQVFTGAAHAESAGSSGAAASTNLDVDRLLHDLLDFIEENHVNPPDRDSLLRAAIKGMFDGLGDPYSVFMDKSEMSSLDSVMTGEFGGIGVRIELISGIVTITAPIPGTPAAEAGLRAGDQIVAVDGVNCIGMGLNEVSALVKGEPATRVAVTIRRDQQDQTHILVRAAIRLQNVESRLIDANTGYIRISEFSEGVSREFADVVSAWQADKQVDTVILDLRNNPGGLLTEAVQMISELSPLDAGAALWFKVRDESFPVTYTPRTIEKPAFRIILLVNRGSASASEIVAGAMKDLKAATLVGTTTFGKGTVQQVYDLPTGEGFKITVAEYLTPFFNSVNGVGVMPDVTVDEPEPVSHLVSTSRDMKSGLVGLDVLALEEGLTLLGYDPGAPDGVFDASTKNAVARLQLANEIPATGAADADTVRVLNYSLSVYDKNQASVDVQLNKAIELAKQWRGGAR